MLIQWLKTVEVSRIVCYNCILTKDVNNSSHDTVEQLRVLYTDMQK